MTEPNKIYCPECQVEVESLDPVDRRDFIRVVGGGAVALAAAGATASAAPAALAAFPPPPAANTPSPGETLVQELFAALTPNHRQQVCHPWAHRLPDNNPLPTRLRMYNAAIFQNARIGQVYTPAQQNLVDQILHAISSGEEGYDQLSREGTWD